MNKDRQHVENDIETCNSISYEHNKTIFKCRMSYFRNYLHPSLFLLGHLYHPV